MGKKLEKMQDESYKNMQNPDFLWEIPQNVTEQHLVREVQEIEGSRVDRNDGRSHEDNPGCQQ